MHQQLFDRLHDEHEGVKKILGQMQETSAGAPKQRQDLLHQLRAELVPHMQGEQEAFYPALTEKMESRDKALEALEEHHAAELILNELSELSPDAVNWKAKARVLQELLTHHISEEESGIFELTRQLLDESAVEGIYNRFVDVEEHMRQEVGA
ncbi:MAG: hemerythrin domain-containing protein [Chitinivibrionales bacterium]|nr:hemerythrin domain-containing protein [Chitinivibrionales bacterium]